jgi:hypothetical protein
MVMKKRGFLLFFLLLALGGLAIWRLPDFQTPPETLAQSPSAAPLPEASAATDSLAQLERYEALERQLENLGTRQLDAEKFTSFVSEITRMTYRSAEFTLVAERVEPGARFSIRMTHADSEEAEACPASDELLVQLHRLATIPLKSFLEPEALAQRFPRQLGKLEIQDRVAGDPPLPMQFFATPDLKGIAVRLENGAPATKYFAAEVDLSAEVFTRLESGCPASLRGRQGLVFSATVFRSLL